MMMMTREDVIARCRRAQELLWETGNESLPVEAIRELEGVPGPIADLLRRTAEVMIKSGDPMVRISTPAKSSGE
jgi:hypothetical protein